MTDCSTTTSSIAAADPHADLGECVARLRAGLSSAVCDGGTVDAMLAQLSATAEQVTAEHAGMAQEVLGLYEQLGMLFEVTRRLADVSEEVEVVDLFVDSLRSSFCGRQVLVIHDVADEPLAGEAELAWLPSTVARARDQHRVLVESPHGNVRTTAIAEVMVGPVFAGKDFVCAIVLAREESIDAFRACDMQLLEALTMFCGDLIRTHRLVDELRGTSMAMVRALVNAVDQKDEYTSGHSLRVGYYATRLGKEAGLSEHELRMLQWSALLHDVGKIGIRDDVLKKEGKLTKEEYEHIKEHPVRSYEVVKEIPQLVESLDGVLYHHERYDGGGYPTGLAGEEIPIQARIIQVADVFDALTSTRSYRPAFPWRKALEILDKESGTAVDPVLQPMFDRMIRDELRDDPKAWPRLVDKATRFGCGSDDMSLGW